jgi:hypothetical protein
MRHILVAGSSKDFQTLRMHSVDPAPQFDFSAWITQARQFCETFARLPVEEEEVTIESRVGPPASEADILVQEALLGHALPGALRNMYLTGSADFACTYNWRFPPPEVEEKLDQILGQEFVYGGPAFCPLHLLAQRKQWLLELAEIWGAPGGEPGWSDSARQCVASLPLADIGNGDQLVFDMTVPSDDPAVLYLCHEEPIIWRIAPSFTAFLNEWEKIAYVGPEFAWMRSWFDHSPTGFLCAETTPTQPLYDVLDPARHPLHPN